MIQQHLIQAMKHSTVDNYVIPGLSSSLIGGEGKGCVRLFECHRAHEENITPHSHRFDFSCYVIKGRVVNKTWVQVGMNNTFYPADEFQITTLNYDGEIGQHTRGKSEIGKFRRDIKTYTAGESYYMTANQIHSISFDKGTQVLFFEGPTLTNESLILEPIVNDFVVETYKNEPWMFLKQED